MTSNVVPFNEQRVKRAIDSHVTKLEELMSQEKDDIAIAGYGFAIDTLIQLEHDLRLCDCPPEAYEAKS
jgi:hypothetical protein